MPLPTPKADESEQDFVSRFMGNDQAIADFPDEKQRAAVAYRTYRDEDEEMEELELPGVSILEEGEAKGHDLYGVAVKCVDIVRKTSGEGESLDSY